MFTRACIINTKANLNTVCDATAAMSMATVLNGLTEVIFIDVDNEVGATNYYLDGALVGAVQAGGMWGPELTAIIEANK